MSSPSNAGRSSSTIEDTAVLLARIALGYIFVQSGFGKLMALGAFAASLAGRGIPGAEMWALIGAVVEFAGGIMIVTGFKMRYTSLLMILFMIVATGISHRYWEIADAAARRAQESQFLKNLAITGGFLLLYVTGSGRFGLDALFRRRSNR